MRRANSVDLRYYIPTIKPLTMYPTLGLGFLAGPDLVTGTNTVMPLFNPGFGARITVGNFYAAFEFGLSGFTIPYMGLSFGYQSDRHRDRAEAWVRKQERAEAQPLRVPETAHADEEELR